MYGAWNTLTFKAGLSFGACSYKRKTVSLDRSLSSLHFLKIPKNSLEVLKVLKNRLEVLKVLKNSLEVLKVLQMELQENSSIDEMSADVARSHGGEGGGKGKRKANLGGRAAGRLNTRDKTRNLSLKEITDTKGLVPIQFELRDKQIVMPLGDHATHWSSYIGEVIRGVPLYYLSWLKAPNERKAALITDIGTEINAGIQQHLQKAYNTNKAAFKAQHWVLDPTTGTYNVEKIRRARPENITASEWDKYIEFWNDPRNIARAAQNRQNRAKSTVISRQGSMSLARLRDEMRQSSTTQEYLSLIDAFFIAHTVNGEFFRGGGWRLQAPTLMMRSIAWL
nr:hypothetical protein [Tanacetum cinerariifolium]